MSDDPKPGRVPPPAAHRIVKGEVRNPRGRPQGAVSIKRLTQKVAMRKLRVPIDGKLQSITLLDLVIHRLVALTAQGNSGAVRLYSQLRERWSEIEPQSGTGFLLAPASLSVEEWMVREERHNARIEEFFRLHTDEAAAVVRAAGGDPSHLGSDSPIEARPLITPPAGPLGRDA